jgi:hypothetical protein
MTARVQYEWVIFHELLLNPLFPRLFLAYCATYLSTYLYAFLMDRSNVFDDRKSTGYLYSRSCLSRKRPFAAVYVFVKCQLMLNIYVEVIDCTKRVDRRPLGPCLAQRPRGGLS